MSLTLMCGLFCFAFTFDNNGMRWIWSDSEPAAYILCIATVICGLLWINSVREIKKLKSEN